MANPQEFIVIADFRLGIWSDYHASSGVGSVIGSGMSTTQNGAATPANTFGCCADPATGALIPLPASQVGGNSPLLPLGNAEPDNRYPAGLKAAFLSDAIILGPAVDI